MSFLINSFAFPTFTPIAATGGTITTPGDGYRYHTFTSSGSFSVSDPGTDGTVEYLVVGGGGTSGLYGPGGGAGGYVASSGTVTATSYTVTVGAGGVPTNTSPQAGNNGSGSQIVGLSVEAIGGGCYNTGTNSIYSNGGSGGGASGGGARGLGTPGQGNDGGGGFGNSTRAGGGGGGAGAAGGTATYTFSKYRPGAGGAGLQWLDGNYYAGGGGGAVQENVAGGAGGLGGGGTGYSYRGNGTNGTNGKGGGAGGGPTTNGTLLGGNGGSGVVIVRYPI